jgi:uncharacterized protein YndB with AHSA1/START domain
MITLEVRKTIRATPEQLFEAWTRPSILRQWWGPKGMTCIDAQIDLRIGGAYRIANRFEDGRVVWIAGEFERIEPPSLLVYTWRVDSQTTPERVTVRFQLRGGATDVIVLHERIAEEAAREQHKRGWHDCLEGLQAFVTDPLDAFGASRL